MAKKETDTNQYEKKGYIIQAARSFGTCFLLFFLQHGVSVSISTGKEKSLQIVDWITPAVSSEVFIRPSTGEQLSGQ